MREVPLSGRKAAGRVARVDDVKYMLVVQYPWHVIERLTGPNRWGPYAATAGDRPGSRVLMHRLLMPGALLVDHRDGDGLNNQGYNLRGATNQQNSANQGKSRSNKGHPCSSQYKGVSWDKARSKWLARIRISGHLTYLGLFVEEVHAARAYDTAASTAFGPYARLNLRSNDDAEPG